MLSIIIPTLNEENYLPLLLKSIKKQTFRDYEIIVADNNSKDRTSKIAEKFGCKVSRGGLPAKGRNEGSRIAKGENFLFVDADDVFLSPNFLKKLNFEFKRRNLAVAGIPILPKGTRFDKFAFSIYNWVGKSTQKFLPYAINAILVKKEVFEKVKGFDESVKTGEDLEFVRRASKIGEFGFIEIEPLSISSRRFDTDGRFRTYSKYLIANLHMSLFGKIKSDIYKYHFGKYPQNKK